MADANAAAADTSSWTLTARSELRFEVPENKFVKVEVDQGPAEVFGVALLPRHSYSFPCGKFAIFTWYGCQVRFTEGAAAVTTAYTSDDTPMVQYVTVHGNLEMQREAAAAAPEGSIAARGPRVMIVGPTDSGKTSFAQMLVSYAVRKERRPIFVDLDPGQGTVGTPGCIGACAVDEESVFAEHGIVAKSPIVFYYGHTSVAENAEYLRRLIEQLAACVDKRLNVDPLARSSGLVINTCGWIDPGTGYNMLLLAARVLKVDTVLVMGHDRLLSDLRRDLGGVSPANGGVTPTGDQAVNIVKLPRSGGVVQRPTAFRRRARDRRIRAYFKGAPGVQELSPSRTVLSFDDIVLVTIISSRSGEDDGMRPVGQEEVGDVDTPVVTAITPILQSTLVGLSHASKLEDVPTSNLSGMLHVVQVDMEARKIALLAPCPGLLPGRFLVLGSVKWVE